MELRQLEYFVEVCKELNFTRASEKLNVSQPSLSQQIKSLEGELGTPLFDRIGKKIAITEAGHILLAHCYRVFHELDQAKAALNDLNGLMRGELSVGSVLTEEMTLLPSIIMKFKQLYPSIKLSVEGLRSEDIRKRLLENELDLGIVFLPVETEEFETLPLFTETLSLVVPKTHRLAEEEEVDFAELDHEDMILFPEDFYIRQLIDGYSEKGGISMRPVLEMTTMESIVEMVAKGLGAVILPSTYVDSLKNESIQQLKLKNPVLDTIIGIAYRKDKFVCAATKAFISLLKERSKVLCEQSAESSVVVTDMTYKPS
jgi:DNA-binding transcriptional LysR family regulator